MTAPPLTIPRRSLARLDVPSRRAKTGSGGENGLWGALSGRIIFGKTRLLTEARPVQTGMKNPQAIQGLALSILMVLASCSGGGGGKAGSGNGGGGGPVQPWAIEDAGLTGTSVDLLIAGDQFVGEMDAGAAAQIADRMWTQMTAPTTWVGTNPLFTYQLYNDSDPFTNWGRAYRHTGFDVYAGPLVGPSWFYGTGTYFAATGEQYDAAILHTWDADYWELIIMMDPQILVHANQHTNGFPLADTYTAN